MFLKSHEVFVYITSSFFKILKLRALGYGVHKIKIWSIVDNFLFFQFAVQTQKNKWKIGKREWEQLFFVACDTSMFSVWLQNWKNDKTIWA